MEELGKRLQQERLSRNIELEQISENTHISMRVLKDIEAGNFEKYKGDEEYIKMYLRKYSEFLGIDSREFVENYISITQEIKIEKMQEEEEKKPRKQISIAHPDYTKTKKVYEDNQSSNFIRYGIIIGLIFLILGSVYYGIKLMDKDTPSFDDKDNVQVSGDVGENSQEKDEQKDKNDEDQEGLVQEEEQKQTIRIEKSVPYEYTVVVPANQETFKMKLEFVGKSWSSLTVNNQAYSGFVSKVYNEANTTSSREATPEVVVLEFNTNDVYLIVLNNGYNFAHRYYFDDVQVEVPEQEDLGDVRQIKFNVVKE